MKQNIVVWCFTVTVLALVAAWGLSAAASAGPVDTDPVLTEQACTSFCLDNAGGAVFGSNYDNEIWEGLLFVNKRGVTKTGWEAGTTGRYARWTAEYGSVTFNLAGAQMAWAGMNEVGLITAQACVLFGPEDFSRMRPGDALVAVTTTPAWTPLFAMASAVVTDIGGPLGHSSIVARELGIPAVVGCGNATMLLKTGDRVRVDGGRGIVEILSG